MSHDAIHFWDGEMWLAAWDEERPIMACGVGLKSPGLTKKTMDVTQVGCSRCKRTASFRAEVMRLWKLRSRRRNAMTTKGKKTEKKTKREPTEHEKLLSKKPYLKEYMKWDKKALVRVIATQADSIGMLTGANATLSNRVNSLEQTVASAYTQIKLNDEKLHVATSTIKMQADRMAEHLAMMDAKRAERCRQDPAFKRYHEAVMAGGFTLKSAIEAAHKDGALWPYVREFEAGAEAIKEFKAARKARDAK